jgi:hypothetical protein
LKLLLLIISLLIFPSQCLAQTTSTQVDDSEIRVPVTAQDLLIVRKAKYLLRSPSLWNKKDNRICPPGTKKVSLFCALEKATIQVHGKFEHRGAVMQECRFLIQEIVPAKKYEHRLQGYNNDPDTTFEDIKRLLDKLEKRISSAIPPELLSFFCGFQYCTATM